MVRKAKTTSKRADNKSNAQSKIKVDAKPGQKIPNSTRVRRSTHPRGKFYLGLVFDRPTWIHRRVETISFLSDDSTKRRVSYDFTLPPQAKKFVKGQRIGVPIDIMRKEILGSLSVTDASGKALSIWGTDQNGALGVEVLESLVSGLMSRNLTDHERKLISEIVFNKSELGSPNQVSELSKILEKAPNKLERDIIAAKGFVQALALNFIFIVEVPVDFIGVRNLIKLSYDMGMDDERASKTLPIVGEKKNEPRRWSQSLRNIHIHILRLTLRHRNYRQRLPLSLILNLLNWCAKKKKRIGALISKLRRWISISENFPVKREFLATYNTLPSSQSEHLEIHAPDDLQVTSLKRYPINENGSLGSATETSIALGHIAHIHFKNDTFPARGSISVVEFTPVMPGLIVQTLIGTFLGTVFLCVELLGVHKLYTIIPNIGDAGPLAAIALALPAFMLSLLVRSREHNYVKAILKAPRAIAFLSACILFISAGSMVLKLTDFGFLWTLTTLAGLQGTLFLIMSVVAIIVYLANRPK